MGKKDRRALFLEYDENYDPFVGIDANEYLIENYPYMSLRFRRAVWSTLQTTDIDWEPIWDIIDATVEEISESFPEKESEPIPYENDEDLEEDDEYEDDNVSTDELDEEISDDISPECES